MTPAKGSRRLLVAGILIGATMLGVLAYALTQDRSGHLVAVGGDRNACRCTQRLEP